MSPTAQGPSHASSSAATSLPPAFPRRAPWGTAGSLRAWQAAALEQYMAASPQDFLAVATPGAGKTTFALRIAVELMGAGVVEKSYGSLPDRAPQKPMGRGRWPRWDPHRSRVLKFSRHGGFAL